jgi:hypothetical protein
MPNLEEFLNKKEQHVEDFFEPVDGSFQCQNHECTLITYEGFLDQSRKKINWICANGHSSSVTI